jgi:hypothetical protein
MLNYTEFIGYAASALVLISFLMKNITRLRVINSIGCGFFILYGAFLPSVPIVLTNAAIVIVNLFYLIKTARGKQF